MNNPSPTTMKECKHEYVKDTYIVCKKCGLHKPSEEITIDDYTEIEPSEEKECKCKENTFNDEVVSTDYNVRCPIHGKKPYIKENEFDPKIILEILEGVYKHGTKQSTQTFGLDDDETTIADANKQILGFITYVIGRDETFNDVGEPDLRNRLREEQRKRAGL